jgi:hypothetical protein
MPQPSSRIINIAMVTVAGIATCCISLFAFEHFCMMIFPLNVILGLLMRILFFLLLCFTPAGLGGFVTGLLSKSYLPAAILSVVFIFSSQFLQNNLLGSLLDQSPGSSAMHFCLLGFIILAGSLFGAYIGIQCQGLRAKS